MVTSIKVSHAVIMSDVFPNIPKHLHWLLEAGVPVMAYGRTGPCMQMAREMLLDRPHLISVEVRIYLRPKVPLAGDMHAFVVRTAMMVGTAAQLRASVPNYVSLEEAHCVTEDNPPMPLMDFFIHTVCKKVPPSTIAIFCRTPLTATHWAMTSIMPLDVVMGLATAEPAHEAWATAVAMAGDDLLPAGLEPEFRERTQ